MITKLMKLFFSETEYGCEHVEGNCLYAASTMIGKGCDNPHDPMELSESYTCKGNTVNQLARSFQVDFENKSSFELDFKVEYNPNKNKGSGRNVVFAFASAWEFKCDVRKVPLITRNVDFEELEDLECQEEI